MASSRLQNALSLLQKKHKNPWPDPESSVGKFCGTKKGRFKCWKAQGPAHEVFQHMSIEIKELLEKDCGPVPSSSFVHFDIFMIGETPATAIPHIMFSCKKREPRKEALTAVRKSEILSHYTPGIELGHWDYPPYIKDLQFLGSSTEPVDSGESTATSQCHLTPVYDKTKPWKVSAMQLQLNPSGNGLGSLRKATVGSILEVADKRFYLAPAHIFPGCNSPQHILSDDDIQEGDSDCEFGGFENEDESLGEEDEVEFMSQYSMTPESSDVESESDFDSEDYSSDVDYEEIPSIEPRKEPSIDEESRFASELSALEVVESAREVRSTRLEIKSPSFTSVELDCALIEVSDNDYLTKTLPTFSRTSVCQVGPGDVDVTTITGSGTALTGTLSGRPLYIRFPDTRKYQKAFVADFAEYLQPGDCGSIVRNARTGDIYGHIFAGSVESKVAYIIPAMDVLEVIEDNFDVFPTSNQYVNLLSQSSTSEVSSDANGGPDFPWSAYLSPRNSEIHDFAPLLAKTGIRTHNDYNLAWIRASCEEFDAAQIMLDEEYAPPLQLVNGPWSYVLGNIGQHNIVIPNPSSEAFDGQTVSKIASRVCSTSLGIKCSRRAGISAGFYAPSSDIRPGRVVASIPSFSRCQGNQDNPAKTDRIARILGKKRILDAAKRHFCPELDGTFLSSHTRPWSPMVQAQVRHSAVNTNQPLEADHSHECLDVNWYCCHVETVRGPTQGDDGPRVHHAHIAPSNRVMEDPQTHDIVSRKSDDIVFEAEAAGLANFPCLIIRDVCDYANTLSRKTKVDWQEYAAATAAAYARELLLSLSVEEVGSFCANHAGSYGGTPLSWAASQGHEAVVRLLLQNNPDVDWSDGRERTALSLPAANGNTLAVSALLASNGDTYHRDEHGRTLSMLAVEMDHESVAILPHKGECKCHHCHDRCTSRRRSFDHEEEAAVFDAGIEPIMVEDDLLPEGQDD